jgi:trans-aconitate 2-methyltransferase
VTAGRRHEWDAAGYDRLPLPHEQWGRRLLAGIELSGDEHVLDAGCGTGRDTALLLERLPRGHVTAVDVSPAMLAQLRNRLAGASDRLTVVEADLTEPLHLERPVDVAVSVAALHWVPDHARAFATLAAVMAPGARLALECGGRGNVAGVREAVLRATGDDSSRIGWNFAGPEETEDLLRRCGFVDVRARLRADPARFDSTETLTEYLRVVILGRHLAPLSEQERDAYVDAVVAELPEPVVDYVRLEVTASRSRES